MKKISALLLCYALIFVPFAASAAIGIGGQDNICPSSALGNAAFSAIHPVNLTNNIPLNPITPKSLGNDIMQFKAGSHIMGFKPDKVYLVNTAGFLSVEFMGTKGVMPKASAGKAQGKGQGLEQLGKVEYEDLWKGITLSYEGVGGGIAESTYRIKPGTNARDIRLKYSAETELQQDGSLKIKLPTARGWMIESKPVAWQEIGSKRIPVEVAFKIEDGQFGFRVAEYDRNRDLIIDPTYQWHTFYGSGAGNDYGNGIAVDVSGNVYVMGYSNAAWNGPSGQSPLNAYSGDSGNYDIFVLKLDTNGAYQWHTFYGSGAGNDYGNGIAVDVSGNVYLTGQSDATWNGPSGRIPLNAYSGGTAIFVLKLNSSGAYQWHTFYGSGAGNDYGNGIAVDSSGDVYLTGQSDATWNGPSGRIPLNAYSGGTAIFVLKLNSSGAYQWHTFYGLGNDVANGIAVDGSGDVYLTGQSGDTWNGPNGQTPLSAHSGGTAIFALKLNSSGAYQWHTFYGLGNDVANGIAVDGSSDVYLTGQSGDTWNGPNGQTPLSAHSGGTAIFALKLNSSGAYQWHTFYGLGNDVANGIAVDGSSDVYLTGQSGDTWNGPNGQTPLSAHSGGTAIFVLKLNGSGAYQWHTFYGLGNDVANGIAVDGSSDVYLTGQSGDTWNGPNGQTPLNAHSGGTAIFVLKLLDLTVPDAPTGVKAVAGNAQATVSFSAPALIGGSPIISYTVTSSPGNITATGASSPITVTGLTNGTAYTFTVRATNAIGTGPASAASNRVTTGPIISVSPMSVDFGSAGVGSTSSPKTVTIKSTGNVDLIINSISVTGANQSEFIQTNNCSTVSAQSVCPITVTFAPALPFGKESAILSISSNDPNKPTVNVKLSGQGAPPKISVAPQSVNFGSAQVGGISAPKVVTVKNTGISDLIINSIKVAGMNAPEFSQENNCSTIAKGNSCAISVTFSPASTGNKNAIIAISSNDPKQPTVNVKLSGQGAPPKISVAPQSVNFGSAQVGGISTPKVVTVKNTGISDLVINSITVTGANAPEFSQENSCSTIAKGSSCAITVTFGPASTGNKNAIIAISSNDPKKPVVSVKLSGKGKT